MRTDFVRDVQYYWLDVAAPSVELSSKNHKIVQIFFNRKITSWVQKSPQYFILQCTSIKVQVSFSISFKVILIGPFPILEHTV